MDNFIVNWVSTPQGLAFIAAAVIVFITMIFVAKRVIGFFLTLLLLVFALVAGLTIANQDLISNYLHGQLGTDEVKNEQAMEQFKEQTMQAYENLRKELDEQKGKIKQWLKEQQEAAAQEAKQKKSAPAEVTPPAKPASVVPPKGGAEALSTRQAGGEESPAAPAPIPAIPGIAPPPTPPPAPIILPPPTPGTFPQS